MIEVYGYSDDLVEIRGSYREEFGPGKGVGVVHIGSPASGGCVVRCWYAKFSGQAGVWAVSVEQLDEDIPIPWPVRIEVYSSGYSTKAIVECPDGTPVSHSVEQWEPDA